MPAFVRALGILDFVRSHGADWSPGVKPLSDFVSTIHELLGQRLIFEFRQALVPVFVRSPHRRVIACPGQPKLQPEHACRLRLYDQVASKGVPRWGYAQADDSLIQ